MSKENKKSLSPLLLFLTVGEKDLNIVRENIPIGVGVGLNTKAYKFQS